MKLLRVEMILIGAKMTADLGLALGRHIGKLFRAQADQHAFHPLGGTTATEAERAFVVEVDRQPRKDPTENIPCTEAFGHQTAGLVALAEIGVAEIEAAFG